MGGQLGSLIAAGLLLLPILGIWSLVISGSCRLAGVRPPEFFGGMAIGFAILMANAIVALAATALVGMVEGTAFTARGLSQKELERLAKEAAPFYAVTIPMVTAAIFKVMLPECTFAKAIVVMLGQVVVIALFLLAIYGISVALKLR